LEDRVTIEYDDMGKIDLSTIYNHRDPTPYFSMLSELGYCIPEEAKPAFRQIIDGRRDATGTMATRIVDVGCSYGVNAALLKFDLSMDDLNAHYGQMSGLTREEILTRDVDFFGSPVDESIEIVGVDPATRALGYALEAGILDAGVATDLEARDPSVLDKAVLSGADLIISTGCYGYVGSRTFETILDQCADNRPWMAHTVLRMFDFAPAAEALEARGYATEKVPGLIPQRRFATEEEQANALLNLERLGVDPDGREAEGWYFAEMYVCRPLADALARPIEEFVDPLGDGRVPQTVAT
jgi:carnitine O-acetyltransferase